MVADGATTYTWNIGNSNNSTNPRIYTSPNTPTSNLVIKLSGSALGCKSATVTLTLEVDACTGIETIAGNSEVAVYPNPFSNELTIGLDGKAELYNALGQRVLAVTISKNESISTAELPKGIYILKAYNEQGKLAKAAKVLKN
jgi:hypothetical protein